MARCRNDRPLPFGVRPLGGPSPRAGYGRNLGWISGRIHVEAFDEKESSMSLALATKRPVKLPVIGSHNHLWAQTIGCRVPRRNEIGHVDAVFERACNVALDSGGLVAVLGRRTG